MNNIKTGRTRTFHTMELLSCVGVYTPEQQLLVVAARIHGIVRGLDPPVRGKDIQ